jgi:hypothetical protein
MTLGNAWSRCGGIVHANGVVMCKIPPYDLSGNFPRIIAWA